MANVRMTLSEASEGLLPETCLKCGAHADHWVKKKMSWHPPWVWVLLLAGVLPFAIVAAILTKRATLVAPMCTAHRRHWILRTALTLLGLLGLIGIIFLLIVLNNGPRGRVRANEGPIALLWVCLIFGFFAWVISIIVMKMTSIRPAEITDDDLILHGVNDQFIDDFEEAVEDEERDDERRKPRVRPRRDAHDDDDDDRPLPRSRPRRDTRDDDDDRYHRR